MTDSAIITTLAGLLGVAIGAWLNSALTTRRERWNLRRELYSRLLESLGEIKEALSQLEDAYLAGPRGSDDGPDEKEQKALDDRIKQLVKRNTQAVEECRRAKSVGAIMLTGEAIAALDTLQKEWNEAVKAESLDEHMYIRRDATEKAYQILIAAAKRDLFPLSRWKIWNKKKQGDKP